MEQKILGISGRKQAGKNLTANLILGTIMQQVGIVQHEFTIRQDGSLWISDIYGNKDYEGEFDIYRDNSQFIEFRVQELDKYIKFYSYAEVLKGLCQLLLGLSKEQCQGTDEQKNSLTELRWEDMPGVITKSVLDDESGNMLCYNCNEITDQLPRIGLTYHTSGQMTAREVMQFVGTDIFRKMVPNVWVDATLNMIKDEQAAIGIITDVRFPNEVEGLQGVGGKVLRLNRAPFLDDKHFSECALDEDVFDWSKFDYVMDNKGMSVKEQCLASHHMLISWLSGK